MSSRSARNLRLIQTRDQLNHQANTETGHLDPYHVMTVVHGHYSTNGVKS